MPSLQQKSKNEDKLEDTCNTAPLSISLSFFYIKTCCNYRWVQWFWGSGDLGGISSNTFIQAVQR